MKYEKMQELFSKQINEIDEKYKEKKRERISRDAGEIIGNLYNAGNKRMSIKDIHKAMIGNQKANPSPNQRAKIAYSGIALIPSFSPKLFCEKR